MGPIVPAAPRPRWGVLVWQKEAMATQGQAQSLSVSLLGAMLCLYRSPRSHERLCPVSGQLTCTRDAGPSGTGAPTPAASQRGTRASPFRHSASYHTPIYLPVRPPDGRSRGERITPRRANRGGTDGGTNPSGPGPPAPAAGKHGGRGAAGREGGVLREGLRPPTAVRPAGARGTCLRCTRCR